MKILHTADLHLGQTIYQNYDRSDEHSHFFCQLRKWCRELRPDALLVSGDIFDIQQPSASTKKVFADTFAEIRRECSDMHIIVTAGNHDSASRIHADSAIWAAAGMTLIGAAPAVAPAPGWEDEYIVRLASGYVVAMPYMTSERREMLQQLLDKIGEENTEGKPVVMMGHTAVTGLDILGHNIEIGNLKTQDVASFGQGFDYLALGHIHKPQTIGHQEDAMAAHVAYPAPVVRYAGSALHVSCDEAYPHSVSLVEIDKHHGTVTIDQLRIDQLRHFYTLPDSNTAYRTAEEALAGVVDFCNTHPSGYIRLCMDMGAELPNDFNQKIYDTLAETNEEVRFNPKTIWSGKIADDGPMEKPTFEVAELQQMEDPMEFVERTQEMYPGIDIEMLREAFKEVELELKKGGDE